MQGWGGGVGCVRITKFSSNNTRCLLAICYESRTWTQWHVHTLFTAADSEIYNYSFKTRNFNASNQGLRKTMSDDEPV